VGASSAPPATSGSVVVSRIFPNVMSYQKTVVKSVEATVPLKIRGSTHLRKAWGVVPGSWGL